MPCDLSWYDDAGDGGDDDDDDDDDDGNDVHNSFTMTMMVIIVYDCDDHVWWSRSLWVYTWVSLIVYVILSCWYHDS